MNMQDIVSFVKEAPLTELGPVAETLATRLYQHRQANNGWTPKELFVACLGIGGMYTAVEIAVEVFREGRTLGYALKKRNTPGEIGWVDQLQIIGAATTSKGLDDALMRVGREAYLDLERARAFVERARLIGISVHDESVRQCVCWSIMHQICVDERELANFAGTWEIIPHNSAFRDTTIVDHHQPMLRWVMDGDRPMLIDFRTDNRYK